MSTAQQIRRRIKSIQNISQMTKAMQAVSASKVHQAQAHVLASRPYAQAALGVLQDIGVLATAERDLHPLMIEREDVDNISVMVITSDRGLAGPYNTNILRATERFAERVAPTASVHYIPVGRKGFDFLHRRGEDIRAEFRDLPDNPTIIDIAPIVRLVIDKYTNGETDEVYIAFTGFINMLTHRPGVLRLLPFRPGGDGDGIGAIAALDPPAPPKHGLDYLYEPSAVAILDLMLPRFIEVLVYQAILESRACEHSARMVAMQSASENAEKLVHDLTLSYNKARQLAITSEMLDIVGGAEALGG